MRLSLHPNPLMPFLSMTRIVTFFFDFRMGYDLVVLFHERTCELLPCGQQWRKLVKLFRRPKSKFYWYDFTVRGRRYRGSTQETTAARAAKLASLKLAQVWKVPTRFFGRLLCCWSSPGASWTGWRMSDWKTRQKLTIATDGGSLSRQPSWACDWIRLRAIVSKPSSSRARPRMPIARCGH